MVLEHLKDQLARDQVDPQLLNRLGWTRDDVEQFVERWEKMFADATVEGNRQQKEPSALSEALRSLGLGKGRVVRSSGAVDDAMRELRGSLRTAPPLEYQEQLRAYLKGTSRYEPARSPPRDGPRD
jgi:hypothetical protein